MGTGTSTIASRGCLDDKLKGEQKMTLGYCKHSEAEAKKRGEDYQTWLSKNHPDRKRTPVEAARLLKVWEEIIQWKYQRKVVFLGPEDFYSSPYCEECLLEKLKEIKGDK